jgi:signal transduction histidine kinase
MLESIFVTSAGPNTGRLDAALLRTILEVATEGIVFIDDSKTVAYINQVGREILRCARRHDPLPTFHELTTVLGFDPLAVRPDRRDTNEPLDGSVHELSVQGSLERGSQPLPSWQQEATIFGVPYLVRGSPVSAEPSQFRGTVLSFKDLGESQQREQVICENLSFASHELLTPITAIKSALDLLSGQRFGELSDKQLRFLQLASRNLERLNNVLTAVLDLSQLEDRTLALDLEEVDLKDPLERALATLEDLTREKGIKLQRQIQDTYPTLLADADRLRQVIYNLVHNAVKFTPEEGVIRVGLEVVSDAHVSELLPKKGSVQLPKPLSKQSLLLTVADTGVGIPAAHRNSIFATFHQGPGPSTDQQTRGRGLGLAVVKTLVEAHGGVVWVESKPGEGSTFRVLLPRLSRIAYFVQTVAARLKKIKIVGSSLTLVIFRVVPKREEDIPKTQKKELIVAMLQQAVQVAENTVRLKSDTAEILDSSLGIFSLLAEIEPQDVPALLERLKSNLRKQAEKQGQNLNMQLVWGMASYPKDVSSAQEMVATAVKAASGSSAKLIDPQQ